MIVPILESHNVGGDRGPTVRPEVTKVLHTLEGKEDSCTGQSLYSIHTLCQLDLLMEGLTEVLPIRNWPKRAYIMVWLSAME